MRPVFILALASCLASSDGVAAPSQDEAVVYHDVCG